MYRQAQEVNVAVEGRARDHVLFEQRIEGVMFDVAVNVVSLELWGWMSADVRAHCGDVAPLRGWR